MTELKIPPPCPIEDNRVDKNAPTAWRLKEGYAHNPLLKFPRNAKCFCGSGLKFKKCHLAGLSRACTKAQAKEAEAAMKRLGVK